MSAPRWLIVKFSAIGDCVMAVPVAAAIRKKHPESFITWAVDSRCAAVVDSKRLIDVCYEIPRESWKKTGVSWLKQLKHFARLRPYKFDFGVDLQGHSKTALCLRVANPALGVASRSTDVIARFLNPIARDSGLAKHTVERNMEVLQTLGDFPSTPEWMMPDVNYRGSKDLITISVGTGHSTKTYAFSRWKEVAETLRNRGHKVALLGGPTDYSEDVAGVENLVGKLTLAQTMGAVAASCLHLAADTGTGHMAAAYGVPLVSVFGYTDPAVYRPYTTRATILDAGKGMDGVSPAAIVSAAEAMLTRKAHAILN